MKKALLLTLSTLLVLLVNAQTYETVGWYNYGYTLDESWSMDVDYFRTHIFPDSTVQVGYSDGMGAPWMHGMGQILDPASDWFDDGFVEPIAEDEPYMVDSIGFYYSYFRPQTELNDTVLIQFYKEENVEEFYENPWEGDATYGERSYARLAYDTLTYRGKTPFSEIVEVMNIDDVSDDLIGFKSYAINAEVNPGEVVGMTVTYYPSNPHNLNDTLDHFFDPQPVNLINSFVMYYYYDNELVYENGIYNHGVIARESARYNDDSNGWGGQYWPGIASGGGLYHADCAFLLSRAVGIEEHASNLSAVVSYPNPFDDEVVLAYSLQQVEKVQVRITNITGKVIYERTINPNAAGKNEIALSNLELESGVYLFSLETSQDHLSGRIIKR
ncbi:MAG: hypothetical protein ACJAV7_000701 [Flavobacteriales bacterium]|jgi:hypothetical protein